MKILKSERVFQSRWVSVWEVLYSKIANKKNSWFVVSRKDKPMFKTGIKKADAVVMVPFHKDKEAWVLVKEYRVPVNDYEYHFPAGLVDEGETPQAAAIREMKEETGLDVIRTLKPSPVIFSGAGLTDESVRMMPVVCTGEFNLAGQEDSESIQPFYLKPEDIPKFLQDENKIFGAKCFLVLNGIMRSAFGGPLFGKET